VQYGVMTDSDPLAPGHEIAGEIVEVGTGSLSSAWKVGDRVAVGWFGGACLTCDECREGELLFCHKHPKITGIQRDGGYGQFVLARAEAVARIPDGLDYTQAGPLVCAGVTMFNALRHNMTNARPGAVVGIVGIGGLGHLGVQFASKMGFYTVAISRGTAKKDDALALGAHAYIDSTSQDVGAELQKLGGAKLIIVTATGNHDALGGYLAGLSYHGTMVVAGVDDTQKPMSVPAVALIGGRKSVRGAASGHSRDSEETMAFAHRFGVKVKTEVFPFSRVNDAYERMKSGKADLRVVINYDE
jgi:propanol-preferring alcohol dehydrogenase